MASLKKVLRSTWLGKRYAVVDGKENEGYADTPSTKRTKPNSGLSKGKRTVWNDRQPYVVIQVLHSL